MTAAPAPGDTAEMLRAKKVARDVEAVFLRQLIGAMRATSPDPKGMFGGQQRIYKDLADEQLAGALSRSGGIGLADMIVRDLVRRATPKKVSTSPAGRPIGTVDGRSAAEGDHQ